MLLGQHCSMLSTILFGIVTPDCGLIQAQQYCSILLTTRNNVAPTILLHSVFNNLLQLIIFCRVVCDYRSSVLVYDNCEGKCVVNLSENHTHMSKFNRGTICTPMRLANIK